jgi:hypothetical protein
MSNSKKNLSLCRETVRELSIADSRYVAGGSVSATTVTCAGLTCDGQVCTVGVVLAQDTVLLATTVTNIVLPIVNQIVAGEEATINKAISDQFC